MHPQPTVNAPQFGITAIAADYHIYSILLLIYTIQHSSVNDPLPIFPIFNTT